MNNRAIIETLCRYKNAAIVVSTVCTEHIYLSTVILSNYSILKYVECLKEKKNTNGINM